MRAKGNEASHSERNARLEQARELFHQGYTNAAIAHALGIRSSTVAHYLGELGLARYRVGEASVDEDRLPKPAASTLEAKPRKCLGCGERFHSAWAGERMCGACSNLSKRDRGLDEVSIAL